MKKFKRLTALALALVMVLGLTTGAGAAGAKYSSWFAPYYKEMQELGILPSSFTSGDLTATITRGEMCELAVVAFEKATGNVIDELERSTGETYGRLYIVGGGAKNAFLNRLTQEATGKQVVALPIEATALGNLKIQTGMMPIASPTK